MADRELPGILLLIASGVAFVTMAAMIKAVSSDMPIFQIVFLRSLLSLPFFVHFLWPGSKRIRTILTSKAHFLRSFFGYTSFLCYAVCLTNLPLSVTVALFYTTPVWALVLGGALLREQVTSTLLSVVLIGIAGVVLIVQPTIGDSNIWIILGLVGAALGALATMSVRMLAHADSPVNVAAGFFVWSSVLGLPLAVLEWTWPSPRVLVVLVCIGALAALAQLFLSTGYSLTRLARGATFDFVRLPASLAIGILLIGERPDVPAIIGTVLILLGSWLSFIYGAEQDRR
ncbi:hypothetical protein C5748_10630 [Phyllobacterium phragmitis]|uniref:EamA domain-containing protein n=1 Tax=Phyllobacterium phragmitis TaxID=2670329 RepID=A0A2S9IT27_9HYPH|nr:DMT family transporter [Phyllobacterium phragmitis]PRD43693.1 hypothetical protein C5748_10630 [Phyllobacterium phragmitis]